MKRVRFQGAVWQVLSEVLTDDNGWVLNLYRADPEVRMHWTAAKAVECVEVKAEEETKGNGS